MDKFRRVMNFIGKVNLFDDGRDVPLIDQLLATRIFLSLFTTTLTIIILFATFTLRTDSITVHSPSQSDFERLIENYPSTLSCPCSQTWIRYDRFLSFNPHYHPICTSQFINQSFISSISNINISDYYEYDYRIIASSQFQILATLCHTSQQMVSDSLNEFFSQYLTTTQVISNEIFNAQLDYLVEQLKSKSINEQEHTSDFLHLSVSQNSIYSALQTNYVVIFRPDKLKFYYAAITYKLYNITCACSLDPNCYKQASIYQLKSFEIIYDSTSLQYLINYSAKMLLTVPGIQIGCLPYNSLLQSTLECFYNQSCIAQIQKYISAFSLVLPLAQSRYSQNTTVNDLLSEFFIESWNEMRNFTAYFHVCAPQSCTYSYDRRFNLLYVIVTLIGIFGGLKMTLYFSTPFVVKVIRQIETKSCCSKRPDSIENEAHSQQNLRDRLIHLMSQIKIKLMTLNLFRTFVNSEDGIYSTRIYLLCLLIGMIILIFYTSISIQTRSITIYHPTLDEYDYLYAQYSSTLKCPCSRLSAPYSSIIHLEPEYHQVCSSDFIKSDVWLLYFVRASGVLKAYDFRSIGLRIFTLLQTFCQMANKTVRNQLDIFNDLQFVTAYVPSRNTFNTQISTFIQQFQQQTVNSFLSIFQLVRTSIQMNQFMVGSGTNAGLIVFNRSHDSIFRFIPNSAFDNECSCGESSSCTYPLGFYCIAGQCNQNSLSPPKQIIPGLVLSCLPVDSLLLSSLQCFYNATCIQMVLQWRSFGLNSSPLDSSFSNVNPLDSTVQRRFSPETKLENVVSQLFIEDWTNTSNFSSYYHQCAPNECTYTYEGRFNRAFIIATALGTIGGLSVALQIFTPFSIILFRRMRPYGFRHSTQTARKNIKKTTVHEKYLFSIDYIRQYLHTLNLYKKNDESLPDDQQEQRCRIATRFYIVLFLISLLTVISFTTFNSQIHTTQYESTLSCPCSQIRVPYSKFLTIKPNEYHQICSSYFVSTDFISMLWGQKELVSYSVSIDGKILSTEFRLLSALCSLAKDITEQKLQILFSQELITVQTLSQESFQNQLDSIINTFIVESPTSFRRTYQYINEILYGNQLQSIFLTNWNLRTPAQNIQYRIEGNPVIGNDENGELCSCDTQPTCTQSVLTNAFKKGTFAGLVRGCLPVHGLRLSTLECFYQQTCLSELAVFVNSSDVPSPLNISIPTRFTPVSSTKIGTIIDELFIESWHNTTNYSNYYLTCAPSTCQYSYMEKNNALYMLTTFLALYGGLTEGLKFLVWYCLCLYWKIRQWLRQRQDIVAPS
ncbi:unnamed protein product [Adineta ricciae]|uniref:Uncharacterized protein n=1 Tax=Adineta ricciae TaxID=249248 RepID=A0A814LW03_ADIRI|nr:unnamed protein product [Adineta ricciae]